MQTEGVFTEGSAVCVRRPLALNDKRSFFIVSRRSFFLLKKKPVLKQETCMGLAELNQPYTMVKRFFPMWGWKHVLFYRQKLKLPKIGLNITLNIDIDFVSRYTRCARAFCIGFYQCYF